MWCLYFRKIMTNILLMFPSDLWQMNCAFVRSCYSPYKFWAFQWWNDCWKKQEEEKTNSKQTCCINCWVCVSFSKWGIILLYDKYSMYKADRMKIYSHNTCMNALYGWGTFHVLFVCWCFVFAFEYSDICIDGFVPTFLFEKTRHIWYSVPCKRVSLYSLHFHYSNL